MRDMQSEERTDRPVDSAAQGSSADRSTPGGDPSRILIVVPKWVGDLVLATPALRAMRSRHPDAHIALLVRSHLATILAGA